MKQTKIYFVLLQFSQKKKEKSNGLAAKRKNQSYIKASNKWKRDNTKHSKSKYSNNNKKLSEGKREK